MIIDLTQSTIYKRRWICKGGFVFIIFSSPVNLRRNWSLTEYVTNQLFSFRRTMSNRATLLRMDLTNSQDCQSWMIRFNINFVLFIGLYWGIDSTKSRWGSAQMRPVFTSDAGWSKCIIFGFAHLCIWRPNVHTMWAPSSALLGSPGRGQPQR